VPCSSGALIAAITAANAAGGGTISLAPGCTYPLTSADNGENGLPVVTTRIGVNGNGATIAGNNGSFRIWEVDGPGGNLSLQSVTITGGSADIGGGIENVGGTVTLNHSQVTGNAATQAGGGIASATFDPASVAKLTLNNSAVTSNKQTAGPATADSLGGGGIVNILGTATLNSSQVDGNTSLNGGRYLQRARQRRPAAPGHQPARPEQERRRRQHGHRTGPPARVGGGSSDRCRRHRERGQRSPEQQPRR
jgi:hypothetical protein